MIGGVGDHISLNGRNPLDSESDQLRDIGNSAGNCGVRMFEHLIQHYSFLETL